MNHEKILRLVSSAMLIGLATVLSFTKIFEAPMGGSVTLLSMLPLCLISLRYGNRWGLFSCGIYAVLQMVLDASALVRGGITTAALIGSFVFDYLLAFGLLGLAGSFRKFGKWGACGGIAMCVALRFVCHTISGCVFFSEWCWEGWNLVLYSVCYNGAYMLPECILTLCGAWLLLRVPVTAKLLRVQETA